MLVCVGILGWLFLLYLVGRCWYDAPYTEASGWWEVTIALVGIPVLAWELRRIANELGRRPKLRLCWRSYVDGSLSNLFGCKLGPPSDGLFDYQISIENTGNAVAKWYIVHFQIPGALLRRTTLSDGASYPVAGFHEKTEIGGRWDKRRSEGYALPDRYTFVSEGDCGVFPDNDLVIADVRFALNGKEENTAVHEFVYTIATERGERVHGTLELAITVLDAD